jgi:FkbM family methyltransferase
MSVRDEFAKAVKLLPEKPTVIEVGSHVGDGVKYILKRRPKADIYAIEPCERNFKKLRRRHENSFCCAISSKSGTAKVIKKGNHRQYRVGKGDEVAQLTLDTFIAGQGIEHIDMIRFDCYGSEYGIFRTNNDFLEITDIINITMHKRKVCPEGVNVATGRHHITRCLKSAGFKKFMSYGSGIDKHIFQLWQKP